MIKAAPTLTGTSVTGVPRPGTDIQWSLTAFVDTATGLDITEMLSDGQHLDTTYSAQITARLNGAIVFQGTLAPTITRSDGVSSLDFALAAVLQGAGPIDTVTITDRSVIDQIYAGPVQGSPLVVQGDRLTNTAVVTSGGTASAGAAVLLPTSSAAISIVAVNGIAVSGAAHAAIGDAVTYQALITLPFTSARALTISAAGPGPFGPMVFDGTGTALPALGHAQFAPGGSYTATVPALTVDGAGALSFAFGTVQPVYGSGPGTIALRYTTRLQSLDAPSAPMAQLTVSERNSAGTTTVTSATAAPLVLDRPSLALQMASLYVSDYGAVFAGSGGPFGFDPNTSQFGGVISSAGLAAEPFQDSLTNLAAGDFVTFVVTVENTALRAAAYGLKLQDTLPAGFVLPPGGSGISVTDGTGTPIGFSGDLFGAGLLLDPSVAISAYDPNSGTNIVLLTFSLQASDTVPIVDTVLNPIATVLQVSAGPGGAEPANLNQSTTTIVTTGAPTVTVIDGLSRPVSIGDLVRFDVTITTIPGSVPDLRIDDVLSPSLSLISASVIKTGAGLTIGAPTGAPSSLGFGTVLDLSDGTNPATERFTVEYTTRAVTSDPAASFTATVSGATPSGPRWSSAASLGVGVTSPALTLRTSAPATAQAGQVIPVTITLANAPGAANAYGLNLANMIPAGLVLVSSSLTAAGTKAAATLTPTAITLPELDAGETITISYRAQLLPGSGQIAVTPSVSLAANTASGFALPVQTAAATTVLTQPALSVSTPLREYRVGDTASFRLTVTLPSGTSPSLRLQNTLPAGFSYLPGSVSVLDGSGAASLLAPAVTLNGQSVILDLGAVTASGTQQLVLGFGSLVTNLSPLGPTTDNAVVSTGYAGGVTASIVVNVADTVPVLSSIVPTTTVADTQVAAPLAGVRVTDPDLAGLQMQSVTVTVDHPEHGTLAGLGSGSYDPASGIYRLTGTAQQIASALSALSFAPARYLAAPGAAITTRFSVTDTDAAGASTSAVTAVSAVTSNTVPTVSGASIQQLTTTDITIAPFTALSLADPDLPQAEALSIRLSDPSIGRLSGQGGSYDPSSGVFIASGTVSALQSVARTLVFTPTHAGTAQFIVTIDDGAGGIAADQQTTATIQPSADTQHVAQHFAVAPSTAYVVSSNGHETLAHGEVYLGPVSTLQSQFIYDASGSVVIVSKTPNSFVKSFSGFDAVALSSGSNVVDAGPGSNFLVGGTGADTFFLDGTHGGVVWDTIVGFHPGDHATLFGFHAGISTFTWADNDGAAGYTGRTLHADLDGTGQVGASLTFSAMTAADMARFVISPGTVGGIDYLSLYNPA